MSDKELDYDDLDALLENESEDFNKDKSKDENGNNQKDYTEPNSTDDRVDFSTVIGNTMSRLNNMKLKDKKEDISQASQGSIANDFFSGGGAELFNDLIMMMQTKENFYDEIINLRDHLDEWIKQNPNSKIIKDRELQLDNLNKRISIYERQDYTDAKYGEELKKLALEYVQIPHPFVNNDQPQQGEGEGEGAYRFNEEDELIALLSKELMKKETIYESAIEYREDLKQWIKEHSDADERVLESRKQELTIYDEVIAVYDSPDYSPDNEQLNEKVMGILEKTKYLYEPLPLVKRGSNNKDEKSGDGEPYHQLKQEFFDTIEKFTTKAMEEINTFDKNDASEGGISSKEQKELLQEMEQNCSPQ